MGMPNAKKHQPMNNEEHNKDAKTNDNPDSFKVVSTNPMTFHVFFDGTGNNMFNTEHRLEDKKKYKEAQDALPETATNKEKVIAGKKAKKYDHLKGQISFENDLSNPAILYKAAEDNQSTIRRIYIEGAGTIREQVDDRSGLAAAMGPSGIMARVHEAYSQVKIAIKNNKNNTNTLIFNVFGFSRGSFYGRYFVALLKQEPKEADQAAKKHPIVGLGDPKVIDKQNKLPIGDVPMWTNDYDFKSNGRALIMDYGPNKVIVNFVGIYDTVAAHGFSHHDDSLKFFLDIGNKQSIKKLVHITAENEYRNHFALVDTNTATSERNSYTCHPTGFKCSLPGAHADVGGGYIKDCEENNIYLSNYYLDGLVGGWGEINWKWFQDKGYYTTDPDKYTQIRYQKQRLTNMPEQTSEEIQAKQQESIVFKENINQLPIDNDVASEEVPQGEFTFVKAWTRDEVRATRTVKGNAYQYIPLELMHKLVTHPKMKAVQFNNEEGVPLLQKSFAEVLQDPVLKTFRDYVIEQGIAQFITEPEAVFSFENAGLTQQEVQYLYHEYIHNQLRPVPDELQDKSGVIEYYFGDWGGYLTNGSRSYNKEKDGYTPKRVVVLDNAIGVVQNKTWIRSKQY